jgi:hypothetical protein
MADKTNMGAVLQFARDIDVKHDEGHKRHRIEIERTAEDVSVLRKKVTDLEIALSKQLGTLEKIEESPVDVGKIVFNPRMVLAIVALVASIITGNWATTWPMRETLIRIQEQFTDNVRLQDERFKSVNEKLDNGQRQMEMRRLEIQQLNNDIQQLRHGR